MADFDAVGGSHPTASQCPFMAEAVEEVPRARILEIMIQNPERCGIIVALTPVYRNDNCAKSVGSEFFNSLG
jgi:hypothetical protein